MKTLQFLLLLILLPLGGAAARQTPFPAAEHEAGLAALFDADGELQDDPGYARYKEGYNAILEEKWSDASKKLSAMLEAFPKSEYRDDAAYWRAYALMHIDRKRAIEAYKKFVREYQKSSYYDDAVADLEELDFGLTVVTSPGGETQVFVGNDGFAYSYSEDSVEAPDAPAAVTVPPARLSTREMRRLNAQLNRAGKALANVRPLPRFAVPPRWSGVTTPGTARSASTPRAHGDSWGNASGDKLDPETQLKLDALYALGDGRQDEKSFETLKRVALDMRQSEQLRYAALDMLSEFRKFDVLPIYSEVARKDTNEAMQSYAIDFISNETRDKNKSVQALIELFNGAPKSRVEQKRLIFFAIAEVGNDRAVDFMTSVAKTSDNYELRREAVYYLGTMGSEKARAALLDIMEGKKER